MTIPIATAVNSVLVLAGLICAGLCAGQVLVRGTASARFMAWVWIYPTATWVIALVVALTFGHFDGDWVHMYWSVQYPLSGLFVCSGAFLARTWGRGDGGDDPLVVLMGRRGPRWLPRGAWAYFTMLWLLALVPLLWLTVHADRYPAVTSPGGPADSLWSLIKWSFGAPRPDFLEPVNASQVSRGLGHPQRDVTVSLGASLIAAWLWIAYCALALCGQLLRPGRVRTIFFLLGPAALVAGILFLDATGSAWIPAWADVNFAAGPRNDGIWLSTQPVLQTYGRVMLAALLSAVVLAILQLTQKKTRSQDRPPPAPARAE